ncbi:MBL fold metallo-hydrolase [Solidesulfovibrio sp.]|uniref:MBL fold metallo-hydrolase n=1 Tax=Solidesulfovibrio sp. TaxID=2910990 RepID=UPI0026111E07|nr:MBL fold metallo-hydrolase [Solidesulfovibrio sp.]
MRVTFVGVGEAFDEALPNTSLFVEGEGGEGRAAVLLDCGFTAAAAYFACPALAGADREAGPDAVWISHFHGDHFLGLPYLLARWHEAGRSRPLAVRGGPGAAEKIGAVVDLAYPNLRGKLGFALAVAEVAPGVPFSLAGFAAKAAMTGHGAPCLALRLRVGERRLYYGGDGAPTEACRELVRGCDVVVQEAYGIAAGVPGHGSVEEALALAREAGAGTLAVVHVRREVRRERGGEIRRRLAESGLAAVMPEPGAVIGP